MRYLGVMAVGAWLFVDMPRAGAWWGVVHSHITAGAAAHLPQPLRGFFEGHIDYVSNRSSLEPPGSHYIDIDNYPSFFTGDFPRAYQDAVALHGESFVRAQGTGPWTYAFHVESLSALMAAAEDSEDWVALLDTAAVAAHYIEDLHNPFHLTRNYNGQYTGNHGIHSRYEGEMIVRHFDEVTYETSTAEYLPSVLDFIFDGIDERYWYVDDVLAADDQYWGLPADDYYAGMWASTGALTLDLLQQASEAVADSWYTAWIDAGSPTTFLPPLEGDFNGDGVVDGADFLAWQRDPGVGDLTAWTQNFGETAGGAGASNIPEPNGLLLIATCGMVVLVCRRR
jgi:hypothetical protein